MIHAHAAQIDTRLEYLFWVFAVLATTLVGLYLYFVNTSILHVVSRQGSERSIETLSRELASLESRYTALQSTITTERAQEFGLLPTETRTYIDSRTSATALSLRDGIIH